MPLNIAGAGLIAAGGTLVVAGGVASSENLATMLNERDRGTGERSSDDRSSSHGDDVDEISSNIAAHSNDRFMDPDGLDHYVRDVKPEDLAKYVDDVINGHNPGIETKYLKRNGRIAYWDPEKGAVVIEDPVNEGGSVFTPEDGKDYFDYELR
ncbi:MAG: hypothetical protein ACRYF3_16900 [Janthinobacterium lividum]